MEKYYSISCEGIDKTGKGQILKYIDYLGKHKYVLMDRGLLSNIAYAKLYSRNYEYDINQFNDWTIAYFACDKEDWDIRCKMNNEPNIDYYKNLQVFEAARCELESKGFDILRIDTSHTTPYDAAKQIIRHMEEKNNALR